MVEDWEKRVRFIAASPSWIDAQNRRDVKTLKNLLRANQLPENVITLWEQLVTNQEQEFPFLKATLLWASLLGLLIIVLVPLVSFTLPLLEQKIHGELTWEKITRTILLMAPVILLSPLVALDSWRTWKNTKKSLAPLVLKND